MADEQHAMTWAEFGERILEGAGVDIETLKHGQMVVWFPAPNGSPSVFKQGDPCPMDPMSRVIAIFQNDDVIRVYTLAVPPEPKPDAWKPQPPACYTLSRTAPTYVIETMMLDVMADEIADEWSELADGMSSAARELEAVMAHIGSLDELIHRAQLLKELQEGLHHGADDEEEEIETTDEGVSDTMPPPAPVAPGATIPS
jgi:hypothetical protein